MSVFCRFCSLQINKGRLSSHYRKWHKRFDFLQTDELENDSEEKNSDLRPECIVCFRHHSTILLPCRHDSTCVNCLMKWWRQCRLLPKCPICRRNVEDFATEEERGVVFRFLHWNRICSPEERLSSFI
jgi:hypothetical protein